MSPSIPRTAEIAERIKLARQLSGMSQAQVASKLGLHRPSVTEIEAGRRKVSADELAALAEMFGVSLAWLVGQGDRQLSIEDSRMELVARELARLDPGDLNRVLTILAAMRQDAP